MINYFYTVFKLTFKKSELTFLNSFVLFLLFGFGGIFTIILIPLEIDVRNTLMLAISLVAFFFAFYLIYPGYKIDLKVKKYSPFKVNLICYLLMTAALLTTALALWLLVF